MTRAEKALQRRAALAIAAAKQFRRPDPEPAELPSSGRQTVLPTFAAQFDLFDGAAVDPETKTPARKRRVGSWGDLQEAGDR